MGCAPSGTGQPEQGRNQSKAPESQVPMLHLPKPDMADTDGIVRSVSGCKGQKLARVDLLKFRVDVSTSHEPSGDMPSSSANDAESSKGHQKSLRNVGRVMGY